MSRSEPKARVLVVDDEVAARSALQKLLGAHGFTVDTAADGETALSHLSEHAVDVVVSDLEMPLMDGHELLARIRTLDTAVPVIVVTSMDEVTSAVAAMRAGAEDYLTKPVNVDALVLAIERALQRRDAAVEAEDLRQLRDRDAVGLQGLLGASPLMQKVYRTIRQVAQSRATVLITGESGTGKGEVARAIHSLSPRAHKPFVSLNCAALAESLLESELFGHEKGSFTGADKRRAGRFEQAHGGTLFLDEIGEISMPTQVRLLQVLQERAFHRVGGTEPVHVDVRLLAATNRDLAKDIRDRRFREDLFYRLDVVHVEMPPLRLRGADVLVLAEHFLERFVAENRSSVRGLSQEARAKLLAHRWPGNVRALENAMERAVVLCDGTLVEAKDLTFDTSGSIRIPGSKMEEIARYAILKTLEATDGSPSRAAEMLGLSVRTIRYRMHEYGLSRAPGTGRRKRAPQ